MGPLRKTRSGWDDEAPPAAVMSETGAPAKALASGQRIVLVIVVLLIVGFVASRNDARTPGLVPRAVTTPATVRDTTWVPSGFQLAADDADVAWRFMASGEVTCTYSGGSCWGIVAIPRLGCPSSLYVELSILDGSGAAIGYTNDVAGAVAPMQQAKLTFDTFEKGAQKARVTKVSCY